MPAVASCSTAFNASDRLSNNAVMVWVVIWYSICVCWLEFLSGAGLIFKAFDDSPLFTQRHRNLSGDLLLMARDVQLLGKNEALLHHQHFLHDRDHHCVPLHPYAG